MAAQPVSSVVTPSGVAIEYFTEPKRHYMIGTQEAIAAGVPDWAEVPSVTTVLEVLDKPALPWWGMTTGITAVDTLIDLGFLVFGTQGGRRGLMVPNGDHLLTVAEITEIVTRHSLTVNHVKAKAGDRGTGVHDALEAWGVLGKLPVPDDHPYEERGYVEALLRFLVDAEAGEMSAEAMEVTVGSQKFGYAGRFDLLARTTKEMRVVTKVYPKWPAKHTVVPASRLLIDLKTSKEIYPTHFLQLEAYEGALIEDGYGPTDARAVLHVRSDGRYEFRRARATHADFIAVLGAHHAMARVKEGAKL